MEGKGKRREGKRRHLFITGERESIIHQIKRMKKMKLEESKEESKEQKSSSPEFENSSSSNCEHLDLNLQEPIKACLDLISEIEEDSKYLDQGKQSFNLVS